MDSECAHACLLSPVSSVKTPDSSVKPIPIARIKAGSPAAAVASACRAPNAARMDGIARRRVRRAIAVSLSLPDGSVWSDNSTRCKVTSVHCVSHILGLSPAHAVRDVAADLTRLPVKTSTTDHIPGNSRLYSVLYLSVGRIIVMASTTVSVSIRMLELQDRS